MKITKPKNKGGLGLQASKEKNVTLLAKLNWRLYKEKCSLWAQVLHHKYAHRKNIFPKFKSCSNTWIGIKKGEAVFKNGIKWIAWKDSQLSFWFDKWLIAYYLHFRNRLIYAFLKKFWNIFTNNKKFRKTLLITTTSFRNLTSIYRFSETFLLSQNKFIFLPPKKKRKKNPIYVFIFFIVIFKPTSSIIWAS